MGIVNLPESGDNLYNACRCIYYDFIRKKEPFSIIIKESLFRNYSAAEYLIKKYNLTKADKEKIDSSIIDLKVKKAIYEILDIK